jgi:hypothetical protein
LPLRYGIVKPSLWLQGLLVVLALLGHDLFMALHPPVAALVPVTNVFDQHSPAHTQVNVTAALPDDHPESPHPTVCGTGGTALFPPVDQLGVPDLNVVSAITPGHFPASAHSSTLLWEEPRWPPGTWRALLQVYRI